MKRFLPYLITLSAILLKSNSFAEDVLLLVAPEAGAAVVAKVHASDPVVLAASEVVSGDAGNNAWQWTEYPTALNGYVPSNAVGKNFAIAAGTPVHRQPRHNADIVTSVKLDDKFKIIDADDRWTRVEVTKVIPVYFSRLPQLGLTSLSDINPTPATEARPLFDNTVEHQDSEANNRPKSQYNPDAKVGQRMPSELPPENVAWRSASSAPATTHASERAFQHAAKARPDDIIVSTDIAPQRLAPQAPDLTAAIPTRTLSGKLVRKLSGFGPRYPLRLVSSSGKRIAYVDMSHIFISDLRPYLGQEVYLSGEVRPLVPGSRELVVFARTIRLFN